MSTPDMVRVLSSHAASFPEDEPLLSAVAAALPKGDPTIDPVTMAAASNFPLASKITLALTPQRILVYKSGWGSKVGGALGYVELSRVREIEIVWNRKLAILAFGLTDAPPVVMRAIDSTTAEHFRLAFLNVRGKL